MQQVNRQFLLRERPTGLVQRSNFDFVEVPLPELAEGEALIRTLYLSLDPTNRIWMSDVPQYMPPVALGEVMRGAGIGQVVLTRSRRFAVGDLVTGLVGWQDYVVAREDAPFPFHHIPQGLPLPLSTLMGTLGMTGLTAYFGLLECAPPRPGETVVVSAAAGAVGSIVGQIAKLKGCRAVGLAGSHEKCKLLVDELGYDAAVCYKDADWKQQLSAACPSGIDVNFENVGGELMDAVVDRMNLHGRIALCGLISGYNAGQRSRGNWDAILMKRITVRGFIITDFLPRFGEAAAALATWLIEGQLKHKETVVEGLEHAPETLNRLFAGQNVGKLMIKVADPAVALGP